jgi:hypothetical protein
LVALPLLDNAWSLALIVDRRQRSLPLLDR